MLGRASSAKEETRKKEAEEKINLKITTAQIKSYSEAQTMPTLQYLADEFYEDDEIEYVITKDEEVWSIEKTKITVGNYDVIYTKLTAYPYEFWIDKTYKLASINGISIANNEIPEGYIKPEGEKEITITENGTTTEDVTEFASAKINVNVAASGGYEESTKIADFTPTVTSDGKKISISMTVSDTVKGYIYFINEKVKCASQNIKEIIEQDYNTKYKVSVIAIDEDGKYKKSEEVNITTGGQISIFNGSKADTATTGDFDVEFTESNSYNNYGYDSIDGIPCFSVNACNEGNYGVAVSNNKINVTNLSSITFNIRGYTNHDDLTCDVFVGIASNKTKNDTFVRSDSLEGEYEFDYRDFTVDVSDLTGEYYLKFITYHPTNVTYYGAYSRLHSIVANEKGTTNQ